MGYVEACRTLIRLKVEPAQQQQAMSMLADFKLVAVTNEVRRVAASLPGKALRSLDVLVTCDHRMISPSDRPSWDECRSGPATTPYGRSVDA